MVAAAVHPRTGRATVLGRKLRRNILHALGRFDRGKSSTISVFGIPVDVVLPTGDIHALNASAGGRSPRHRFLVSAGDGGRVIRVHGLPRLSLFQILRRRFQGGRGKMAGRFQRFAPLPQRGARIRTATAGRRRAQCRLRQHVSFGNQLLDVVVFTTVRDGRKRRCRGARHRGVRCRRRLCGRGAGLRRGKRRRLSGQETKARERDDGDFPRSGAAGGNRAGKTHTEGFPTIQDSLSSTQWAEGSDMCTRE